MVKYKKNPRQTHLAQPITRIHAMLRPLLIYISEIAIQVIQHDRRTARIHEALNATLLTRLQHVSRALDIDLEHGVTALHGIPLCA